MAVITGYYISRLSDGKTLVGNGFNSEPGVFNPESWAELTSTQLTNGAYWAIVDLTQPYSSYAYELESLVDNLPPSNGDWQQDLFRLTPIQINV